MLKGKFSPRYDTKEVINNRYSKNGKSKEDKENCQGFVSDFMYQGENQSQYEIIYQNNQEVNIEGIN